MAFNMRMIVFGWLLAIGTFDPVVVAAEGRTLTLPPAPTVTADRSGQAAQPMTVVRMRGKDMCGSRCPEWIMAQGLITPDTPERFRRQFAAMGREKLPVVIDSEGGDLDAALAIGRMIRALGLTTVVGRAQMQGCTPSDTACSAGRPPRLPYHGFVMPEGKCSGACLFILAGGVERAGYWITAAQLSAPETFTTRRASGDAAALIGVYLADMGISPGLIPRIRRSTQPLDRADMLHFGLSTGRQRVEDITGSSICVGSSTAANCVALAEAKPLPPVAAKPRARRQAAPRPARLIVWGAIDEM